MRDQEVDFQNEIRTSLRSEPKTKGIATAPKKHKAIV